MFLTYIYGFMEIFGERNAMTIISKNPMNRDDIIEWLCDNRANLYPYSFEISKVQWITLECIEELLISFFGNDSVLNDLSPTDIEIARYRKSKNK